VNDGASWRHSSNDPTEAYFRCSLPTRADADRLAWGEYAPCETGEWTAWLDAEITALAGRLLPDGGLTRTEWAVTTPRGKQIHYVWDEAEAHTCAIYGPDGIPVSRQVTNWPDGSALTTPWVPVPDSTEETADGNT